MTTYCYISDDGQQLERQFPLGKAPQSIDIDGKVFRRDFYAEHAPPRELRTAPGEWPFFSWAA